MTYPTALCEIWCNCQAVIKTCVGPVSISGPVITNVLMSLDPDKVHPIDHLDCLHVEDVVGPVDSEHRES